MNFMVGIFLKMKKNKIYVILFFVLLAFFRLSLITKGHRFDLDEDRYLNALYVWIELSRGHFSQAIAYFFNALARPGFVFVSLIPAGCQLLLYTSRSLVLPVYIFMISRVSLMPWLRSLIAFFFLGS